MAKESKEGITVKKNENLSDGRVIPLNRDSLFYKMQYNSTNLGFVNANSTLDGNGEAIVTWNIPTNPSYEGQIFYAAFVTLNCIWFRH